MISCVPLLLPHRAQQFLSMNVCVCFEYSTQNIFAYNTTHLSTPLTTHACEYLLHVSASSSPKGTTRRAPSARYQPVQRRRKRAQSLAKIRRCLQPLRRARENALETVGKVEGKGRWGEGWRGEGRRWVGAEAGKNERGRKVVFVASFCMCIPYVVVEKNRL